MGCLIILAAGALEYFLAKRERTRLSAEKFL
jgi:hypothetical protein